MSGLLPIQAVNPEDVRRVVRESLGGGLDHDNVADFLASVDWSGVDREMPSIAAILGEMESWDTEYAEGDSSRAEYIARLLTLVPADERRALEVAASAA